MHERCGFPRFLWRSAMSACSVFATRTGMLWYFMEASIRVSLMMSEVVRLLYRVPATPPLPQNSVSSSLLLSTDGV